MASSSGFDSFFLGLECPIPGAAAGRVVRVLAYTHFSVHLDPERRLAAVTAVNIDGATAVDAPRGDDWHLDERIPASEQTGPEVYARNDLDRGHLVRRRDPVWGPDATKANYDTFSYANAAPQVAEFNQSKELWNGLEDHVLAYAETNGLRLSVFTGPVFGADDPEYRGVRIPLGFWKVAAWNAAGVLRAAGFVLDQSPQLDGIDLETARATAIATDAPPPLGPFRTFQVAVGDLAALTGLDFGVMEAADVFERPAEETGIRPLGLPRAMRWRELESAEAIRL